MEAYRRDIKFLFQAPAVKSLNVLQLMGERQVSRGYLVMRESVKHEGIIRVWTVAHGKSSYGHGQIS
jgi:hypothetical protein